MDVAAFVEAFDLMKQALDLAGKVLAMAPIGPKRRAAEEALKEAKNAFQIASVKAAKEFGYPICGCTWPPRIMLAVKDADHFRCPKCGRTIDVTPTPRQRIVRSEWIHRG